MFIASYSHGYPPISLTNGTSVSLKGILADSPGRGQDKELQVEEVKRLGGCDPEVRARIAGFNPHSFHIIENQTYPIQKQSLSVEYLRDHCHLRTRTDQAAALVRLRDSTLRKLHGYFEVSHPKYRKRYTDGSSA